MKRRIKRKQLELLHDALGIMAAELVSVENSLNQRKQCRCNQAKFGRPQFLFTDKPFRTRECFILVVFSWSFYWCNSYDKPED